MGFLYDITYMPYTSRVDEVECISVSPNGDLGLCSFTIGNIYKDNALSILNSYAPYDNPITRALLDGGVPELLKYAERLGVSIDTSDCYSACGACRITMAALKGAS